MFTKHKTSVALAACLLFTHNTYSMQDLNSNPLVKAVKITGALLTLTASLSYSLPILKDAYSDTLYQIEKKRFDSIDRSKTAIATIKDGNILTQTADTPQWLLDGLAPKPTPLSTRIYKGAVGIMVIAFGAYTSNAFWNFDINKINKIKSSAPIFI